MTEIDALLQRLTLRGHSQYGGEAVTQIEHALQAAALAEKEQASDALIAAALLHDVGHLLHDLPQDAPEHGIDDHHENAGYHYLCGLFPDSVTDPVRLHVAAKRYLCTVEPSYREALSQPSLQSFYLQGGEMSADELQAFEREPHAVDATRLRRWDDAAKIPNLQTLPLSHFAEHLRNAAKRK